MYCMFRKPIAEAFKQQHRPYRTTLAMQYSTISADSLWRYVVDTPRPRWGTGGVFTTASLLILSTAFVLASQTWLSAMTGYQAKAVLVMPWANNTYVSLINVSACMVVIEDANRIGLPTNTCVPHTGPLADALTTCTYHPLLPLICQVDVSQDLHSISSRTTENSNSCAFPKRPEANDPAGDFQECYSWVSFNTPSNITYNAQTFSLDSPTLNMKPLRVSVVAFTD